MFNLLNLIRALRVGVSLSKTLYVNFRLLQFNRAIKLPIYVYRRFNLKYLRGELIIDAPICQGMVKLGIDSAGYVTAKNGSLRLLMNSKLRLKGKVIISQGVDVLVNRGAELVMSDNSLLGDSAKIICYKYIYIGKSSGITWESQVTDFNSHYIEDTEKNIIPNILKPVHIGDYCWIGNRTTILPGTRLPNRIICASNSLLNKDYISAGIESYSLIGGQPARLIRTGVKRVYDRGDEAFLNKYFAENECDSVESSLIKKDYTNFDKN